MSDITPEQAAELEAKVADDTGNSYAFLDWLEEDPAKRVFQAQQCRIHILKNNGYLDKEQTKLLKDLTSTDLGLLRLDVDRDNASTLAEMAGAVASLFLERDESPFRKTKGELTDVKAPQLDSLDLGDKDVPDWSLSQELAEIPFEDIVNEE